VCTAPQCNHRYQNVGGSPLPSSQPPLELESARKQLKAKEDLMVADEIDDDDDDDNTIKEIMMYLLPVVYPLSEGNVVSSDV